MFRKLGKALVALSPCSLPQRPWCSHKPQELAPADRQAQGLLGQGTPGREQGTWDHSLIGRAPRPIGRGRRALGR